jgi:hypothetical protein
MQLKSVATTIILLRSVATTATTTNTHRSRTERVRSKKRLSSSLAHILQDHHRSDKTSNHHRSTKTFGHHHHSNEKTHHQHQDRIKPPDLRRTTTPAGKQQLPPEKWTTEIQQQEPIKQRSDLQHQNYRRGEGTTVEILQHHHTSVTNLTTPSHVGQTKSHEHENTIGNSETQAYYGTEQNKHKRIEQKKATRNHHTMAAALKGGAEWKFVAPPPCRSTF